MIEVSGVDLRPLTVGKLAKLPRKDELTVVAASAIIPHTSCTEPGRTISKARSPIWSMHSLISLCRSSTITEWAKMRSVDMQI